MRARALRHSVVSILGALVVATLVGVPPVAAAEDPETGADPGVGSGVQIERVATVIGPDDAAPTATAHARISGNGHYALYLTTPNVSVPGESSVRSDTVLMRRDLASGRTTRLAGPGTISWAEMSDDGSRVAFMYGDSSGDDARVYLWTAADEEAEPISPAGLTSSSSGPMISDNGEQIVWIEHGGNPGRCDDGWEVVAWSPTDGESARRPACALLGITAGGRFVYIAPRTGVDQARWDVQSGELAWFAGGSVSDDGAVVAVPDESTVTFRVEGRPPFSVEIAPSSVDGAPHVALSGDGTIVAVSSVIPSPDDSDNNDDANNTRGQQVTTVVIDLFGGARTQLPASVGIVADISDDGRWLLADRANENGTRDLTLVDLDPLPRAPLAAQMSSTGRTTRIARLYRAYEGRLPAAATLYYLQSQRESVASISDTFARTAEFEAGPGALDDLAFATYLYTEVLGRVPDPVGVDYWVAELDGGMSRSEAMLRISESPEFGAQTMVDPVGADAAAQLWRLYDAFFEREPDQWGFEHWYRVWQRGVGLADIAELFAATAVFQDRYGSADNEEFVQMVYDDLLGREPVNDDVQFWSAQLDAGLTRAQLVRSIAESPEFVFRR